MKKKLLIALLIFLFVWTPALAGVGDIISKGKLSGSTDGKAIKITGSDTAGAVVVHTAVAGTTNFDEIWLWAYLAATSAAAVYIEWGTHADADDLITKTIPLDDGLYLLIPGLVLQNGMTVEIFTGASAVDKVFIFGYVHHLTGG